MSAPPLPDTFGNYALGEDFVEIVPPAAISWLPQTAGWTWLGVFALLLLARYGYRSLQHWYRNRYRREAITRIMALGESTAPELWLVELNKLLKLTALAGFTREKVAPLSGQDWADFFNRHCAEEPFTSEQQALLASGIYRAEIPGESARKQLLAASLIWVRTHEGPNGV